MITISFYLKEKLTKCPVEKLLKVMPNPLQLITCWIVLRMVFKGCVLKIIVAVEAIIEPQSLQFGCLLLSY